MLCVLTISWNLQKLLQQLLLGCNGHWWWKINHSQCPAACNDITLLFALPSPANSCPNPPLPCWVAMLLVLTTSQNLQKSLQQSLGWTGYQWSNQSSTQSWPVSCHALQWNPAHYFPLPGKQFATTQHYHVEQWWPITTWMWQPLNIPVFPNRLYLPLLASLTCSSTNFLPCNKSRSY